MPKQIKQDKSALALGEARDDIIREERRKKISLLPLFLIILGISLMFTGIFFNRIISFFNLSWLFQKIEKINIKKEEDNKLVLKCTKETEDETSGVKIKIEYKFDFSNESKLQYLSEKRTLSPIKYSEIGMDNIKNINKQYKEITNKFADVNGISITSKLKEKELTVSIDYDYLNIDKKQIPDNKLISVNQDYTQTYKIVKKDMVTKYNSMCE